MNGTKKKKGIIIAVVLLSAVLLAGIAVAVVFGLRAVWRREVVEDMSVPSASQSITIKINSYGVSAGEKYSGERVIKYDPVRQGLWLYVSYDNGCVFAFDDVGVRVYGDPASEDAFIETFECGADIFSEYGGVWEDFEAFIFERRNEAVKGVWKRGDEYSVTLDGDFLIDNGFLNLSRETGIEYLHAKKRYGSFECDMSAPEGELRSLHLRYNYAWSDYWFRRYSSKSNIEIEVAQGVDFSDAVLPQAFFLAQSQMQGDLLGSAVRYSDEYADTCYVSPDGAVSVYRREAEDTFNYKGVNVYAEEGVLTVMSHYKIKVYSLSSLQKLSAFEFYSEVCGSDVADGRLAVLLSGVPQTGSSKINAIMPKLSYVYLYDLASLEETGRFDVSDELYGEASRVVYDGEDVFFADEGGNKKLDTSTGRVTAVQEIPSSSAGTDGGGLSFVSRVPQGEEEFSYPVPRDFSKTDYTGYSFGGYDLVSLSSPDAFGLYDRAQGRYDLLFPKAAFFGSGEQFVCSLGKGKYLCFVGRVLFSLDLEKLEPHYYE